MITKEDIGCRVLLKSIRYNFTSQPQSGTILEVAKDYFNILWDNGVTIWCRTAEYDLIDHLKTTNLLCEVEEESRVNYNGH